MIRLVLIGKSDISEQLAWCKRYSQSRDEEERHKSAKIEIQGNLDLLVSLSEPALDSQKLIPKLQSLNLKSPPAEELDVFTSKIVKQISIYALFEGVEKIPGKPDYEYGLGFMVETYNIFFEPAVYKTVEVTEERKKMGGLMKETVKVQDHRPKACADVFGDNFKDPKYVLSIAAKEKDNRDQMRFGIRVMGNLAKIKDNYVPMKLEHTLKDEASFFSNVAATVRAAEEIVNKIYTVVGYDASPEFHYFIGPLATDRKVKEFQSEDMGGTLVLNTLYE